MTSNGRVPSPVIRRALVVSLLAPLALPAQGAPAGKATYERWCAGCHGDDGAGAGPGARAMLPRPRDFTRGVYKIRTTASGEIPTDADIRHVVDEGMPGTAMPGWKGLLSEDERRDVVAYVKAFSPFFASTRAKPLPFADAPGDAGDADDAAIAGGRETFRTLECYKCHGQGGRGDGTSAPTLTDDWDFPIRAADLTQRWSFRGGGSVREIYARLRTGLDGTPMPSFADAVEGKLITDAQLWQLAQYVHSLSPEPPPVREVVRARLVAAIPGTPTDSAWRDVERSWIPTVGQVIERPRWFTPAVTGVWVQAVHDGQRLALRLSWSDPSRSPAPAWDEWLARLATTVDTADGPLGTTQGPDRLTLQWAPGTGDGTERPYFLGGTTRRPVQSWRWTSTPDRVEVGRERGLGTFAAASPAPTAAVTHRATWDAGEWRLQVVRVLGTASGADTSASVPFMPGRAVPLALRVADGSSGEDDRRAAVSAWYAVHLDVPTPVVAYAAPVATVLLTAGLGVLLIGRAQRRERAVATGASLEPGD